MSNARRDLLDVAIHVRPHFPVCADVCRTVAEYIFGLEQRLKDTQARIKELEQRLAVEEAHSEKYMSENQRLRYDIERYLAISADQAEMLVNADNRIALLKAALSDALDSYEEYAQYAGEFLCKKHRVGEDIAEKRALLQEQGE